MTKLVLLGTTSNPTMQYSVMPQGVIEFKQKNNKLKYLKFCCIFFYIDDYSTDVHIDESNFSYI